MLQATPSARNTMGETSKLRLNIEPFALIRELDRPLTHKQKSYASLLSTHGVQRVVAPPDDTGRRVTEPTKPPQPSNGALQNGDRTSLEAPNNAHPPNERGGLSSQMLDMEGRYLCLSRDTRRRFRPLRDQHPEYSKVAPSQWGRGGRKPGDGEAAGGSICQREGLVSARSRRRRTRTKPWTKPSGEIECGATRSKSVENIELLLAERECSFSRFRYAAT
ncbi:uncharacterized protein C8Q71DRAFT_396959 [Rhodofomes roseus]|uniref:Uncharacterized protein n=1 Tax=Rhodofomes roseus TaxID=34475 RepID=A0ABQ8JZD5_9APHY|nr:uncharacterized protein C8Q71DRAFT_396959 [Rhodofomes roseus]KAH9829673.1 hypothetical protein C8Q71DRAFT_396959 [Rhodofomes roseus]